MRTSTDSWFVIDGQTPPVPENDADDEASDRTTRIRGVLMTAAIVGALFTALLLALVVSRPAHGPSHATLVGNPHK